MSAFSSVSLGKSPIIDRLEDPEGAEEKIAGAMQKMKAPDAVFTAANGSWFDETESRAIRKVFPDISQKHPKEIFGETLGCGYMMNVLLASASIRNGIYSTLLVSGIDMTGNYTCVMLEK